jgi:hypothetical protein
VNEDAMTRTVPCPECHRPARVVDSFTVQRATGPVTFLRVQCDGTLSFLVNAEEMAVEDQQPPAGPAGPLGGVA